MKIAFLGGAFDPPHVGHFKIIEYCINLFDKVLIVPNKESPSDNKKIIASYQHRINMLNILFENQNVKLDNFELLSNKKNYTYYTIKYLKDKYKNDSITMILGQDQLEKLDQWYNYDYIVNNISILCFARNINKDNNKNTDNVNFVDFNYDISSTYMRNSFKNSN